MKNKQSESLYFKRLNYYLAFNFSNKKFFVGVLIMKSVHVSNNFTNLSRKRYEKNYRNLFYERQRIMSFLKANFYMESEADEIINFIMDKEMMEIIENIPKKVNFYFNKANLNLSLESKYENEKWIVVTLFTTVEGYLASERLDELEEFFISHYQDKFLDNLLFSVEFE